MNAIVSLGSMMQKVSAINIPYGQNQWEALQSALTARAHRLET